MAGQISKLKYVDNKLGAPTGGQQTTRVLWHTITNPGTQSELQFFNSFQGLTAGQSNLTQNKLDSSESMVIKSLWFAEFDEAGVLQQFGGGGANGGLVVDITIGNQKVVKSLPIHFNSSVGEPFDRIHGMNNGVQGDTTFTALATRQLNQPVELRLLTNIVIPPQVEFTVTVRGTNIAYGDGSVVCALSGYGQIFSAGGSF
jgi:hypothetical protein